MKSTIFIGKLSLLLLSVFLAASTTLAAKPVAVFDTISGLVQLREAKGKWQNARVGAKLSMNTEIQTGPTGKATLTFANGSKIALTPGTLVSLDQYGEGAYGSQTTMSLRIGRMNADIAKINDANVRNHFRVRTPTVVAGVRGTIQEVGYTPDRGTLVVLVESSSEIVNRHGQRSVVPQGGHSSVSKEGTVTADKHETKTQTATMVMGHGTTAGEAEMATSAGDFTFSSNTADFDDFLSFFDDLLYVRDQVTFQKF